MTKSNKSISLSKNVEIHGVNIRKMPCGKYFEALQTLEELPKEFVKELSINEQEFKLSEMFTLENILNVITRLIIIAPKFIFNFLSKILEVDKNYLENEVSPTELLEICKKFWEINKLESFFEQMKPIQKKLITLIGFKEQ